MSQSILKRADVMLCVTNSPTQGGQKIPRWIVQMSQGQIVIVEMFVGWTDSVGKNVAWSVCGWTDLKASMYSTQNVLMNIPAIRIRHYNTYSEVTARFIGPCWSNPKY
jgi:hypothetical protein